MFLWLELGIKFCNKFEKVVCVFLSICSVTITESTFGDLLYTLHLTLVTVSHGTGSQVGDHKSQRILLPPLCAVLGFLVCLDSLMGAGDLNSAPHACVASPLTH